MPAGGKRPGAGRKEGTSNKLTREHRKFYLDLVIKMSPMLEESLMEVREESHLDFIKCIKMLDKDVMPPLASVDANENLAGTTIIVNAKPIDEDPTQLES